MDPDRDASTQAASSSAGPVPGSDPESFSAEAPTAPTSASPRVPVVGDEVIFGGRPAKVITVHPPGDADAEVDLVVYHGSTPEVSTQVFHDLKAGWCWGYELPPPPPTLAEKLNAAKLAGIKVPAIGQTVLLIEQGLDLPGEKPFFDRRAKVTAITGIHGDQITVSLDVFANPSAPEDPRQADPLTWNPHFQDVVGPVRAKEGWSWPDWVCPPREPVAMPTLPCTRCGTAVPHSQRVRIHSNAMFGRWRFSLHPTDDPVASLCQPCADSVLTLATTPPDPAVVLRGGSVQRTAANPG